MHKKSLMMMSSANSNNNNKNGSSNNNKHSLLDRSIPIVLPVASRGDDLLDQVTPSRKDGVPVQLERLHRLQGTSLISMGIHILHAQQSSPPSNKNASTQQQEETAAAATTAAATTGAAAPISSYSPTSWYASACTIFHRYYHGVSLVERDVWSVAMAATLIAAKLEEIPLTVRQLIIVYAHLYTRRQHVVVVVMTRQDDDNNNNASTSMMLFQRIVNHPEVLVAKNLSQSSSSSASTRRLLTTDSVQALSPKGPIWKEWHEALLQTESSILRQLGFVLHWIPNRGHVHKFVYAFLHVLRMAPAATSTTTTTSAADIKTNDGDNHDDDDDDDDDDMDDRRRRRLLAQGAWNYCNLSYRLDLCVRFEAAVIACAAIYLAAIDLGCCNVDQDLRVVKSLFVSSTTTTTTTATTMNQNPCWWKILLLGNAAEDMTDNPPVDKTATDLIQITNTLAGLASVSSSASDALKEGGLSNIGTNRSNGNDPFDQDQLDVLVASVAFLKPLNSDSFHGPDSFVWEMANRHDAVTATTAVTNLR
jgi:cyclin L